MVASFLMKKSFFLQIKNDKFEKIPAKGLARDVALWFIFRGVRR